MKNRIKSILAGGQPGQKIRIQGWIKTVRHSKSVSFVEVSDGSSLVGIQAVLDHRVFEESTALHRLGTGASISVTGELTRSPGGKQAIELQAESLEVIGEADADYPLQKKRHSFEYLRTIAHLRPRSNTMGAVLRVRSAAALAIHRFFQERDFVYLHSPIITASDCEGAGEMFQIGTASPDKELDLSFFGRPAFLTVSGQLEAEIAALALKDVYTFGPTFRAENSNTSRHLSEFWMVEPEMAFCDLEGNMLLAEDFLRFVIQSVLDSCQEDMDFFNTRIDSTLLDRLESLLQSSFERLTYTEAVEILERSKESFEFPVSWGADLQSEHERYLTEKHCNGPVIVTDYPREIKAFYMHLNEDGKTVAAMDLLVPQIGEMIGGSQREARLEVLDVRMTEQGLDPENYWWYRDLRRYGSVPHSGFGLGFERFIQLITGMANIRDVIPFPRVPGHAEF